MEPLRYNPRATSRPVDHTHCAAGVETPGCWGQWHQCSRRRQPGKEWCGTHDPDRVAARDKLRHDKRVAGATAAYKRSPLRKVEALQKELAALSVAYEARGDDGGVRTDLARHRVAVEGLQNDKTRLTAEVVRLRALIVRIHVVPEHDHGAGLFYDSMGDEEGWIVERNDAYDRKPEVKL